MKKSKNQEIQLELEKCLNYFTVKKLFNKIDLNLSNLVEVFKKNFQILLTFANFQKNVPKSTKFERFFLIVSKIWQILLNSLEYLKNYAESRE